MAWYNDMTSFNLGRNNFNLRYNIFSLEIGLCLNLHCSDYVNHDGQERYADSNRSKKHGFTYFCVVVGVDSPFRVKA
jgi:hypothetical protein